MQAFVIFSSVPKFPIEVSSLDTHVNELWEYDTTNEQFKWRGNGSVSTLQGYPFALNAAWPADRDFAPLFSSKNLLWLFGGYYFTGELSDLSTFSDGMICLSFTSFYLCILFHILQDSVLCSSLGVLFYVISSDMHLISENTWTFSVNVTLKLPKSGILIKVLFHLFFYLIQCMRVST